MKSKKGFTLVELLAVVVILGIIMTVAIPAVSKWINRSKDESKESQKQTLLMAGQAYAQGNSRVLPKNIGETKLLKAEDIRKANYLKENLKDADKKDCMKDSFVRVYKYDRNGYTYTAYIYCEGDVVPDTVTGEEPDIQITFSGDTVTGSGTNQNIEDVSLSAFRTIIKGSKEDSTLGVDGYSYSVSVKYNGTGEYVEIFHSGNLNGGGRPKVIIEKQLSEYTNITSVSEFLVTVEAYNRDGGYKKQTANSKYGDNTPPKCGEIIGEAGENQWFKDNHVSHITVKCVDNENGSGCVKNEFTKSFNTEINTGVITISDNAGNTRDCTVRVHHDWTYPTLTITAYKRNSDGTKGAQVGTVTGNNTNRTVSLNTYTGSYGTNQWLNFANFRYGVYYEITTSDNILIDKGQWFYNATGISSFSASNLNTMTAGSSKTFTKTDNKTNVSISAEGIRRARYEVSDKAGNKTIVNIEANIDVTPPQCTSSGGSATWINGNRTLTGTCSDATSKCTGNVTKPYSVDINSTVESPGVVYDNANNSTTCPANQTVKIDKTAPSCTVTKTVVGSVNGVSVSINCNDGGSGIRNCPTSGPLKASASFTVVDNVGHTNSCSVTVTPVIQYSKRIRNALSCTSSCCGTHDCNCRDVYSAWSGWSFAGCGGSTSYTSLRQKDCSNNADATCSGTTRCVVRTRSVRTVCDTCNDSCTSGNCCGYSNWSAMSDWGGSENNCNSATCESSSRTIYN